MLTGTQRLVAGSSGTPEGPVCPARPWVLRQSSKRRRRLYDGPSGVPEDPATRPPVETAASTKEGWPCQRVPPMARPTVRGSVPNWGSAIGSLGDIASGRGLVAGSSGTPEGPVCPARPWVLRQSSKRRRRLHAGPLGVPEDPATRRAPFLFLGLTSQSVKNVLSRLNGAFLVANVARTLL